MNIPQQIQNIRNELPPVVRLVAVSKLHPAETLMEAYNAGQRIFGESKVQELTAKHEVLPQDIEWHFIGHLQTNKIKYIVPFVSLIHSIDSINLLREVDRHAGKAGKKTNVLFQIHIAKEETKYGFSENECYEFLTSGGHNILNNTNICGLMGMATFTENTNIVRAEFKALSSFFHQLKQEFFPSEDNFKELSMGMSEDYPIAIEEGSTLVRIGSKIFGERVKS